MIYRHLIAAAILMAWFSAHAKTATELFESVSNSIVVVLGKNVQGKTQSQGSGVVLSVGEVVTNCHVVQKSTLFSVKYRDRDFSASLKHTDHDRDVCSLSVSGLDAPAAKLGSTKSVKVGQKIFAVGAPRGLDLTLSEGIVSSLREVKGGRYLQISAPISPGSSGGGLFDEEGFLIGLPTFYLTDGQQLNFAVPVEWIKELPQRHVAGPKVRQSSLSWVNRAIQLEEKKNWPAMLLHAQAWTVAEPTDAAAWLLLASAYVYADQVSKAIDAYQRALRINPELLGVWYNLGVAHSKLGETDKAIKAYERELHNNPSFVSAWFNLGNAYGKSGRTAKAIEAYRQGLNVNPENVDGWVDLGMAYGKSRQNDKAVEAFQQALRINPENADAWYNIGIAYSIEHQLDKVTEVYRVLRMIDPKRADAFSKYVPR